MKLVVGESDGAEFSIDAQELVTGRTCLIAQSGAGKSWAIAVLCEQMCKAGIGFIIIDTEGEYFSLKEKFDLLWIGSDENCDANIEQVDIKELMQRAVQNNIPVIFDVSETDMRQKVSELADILYEIESELRRPYLMIIEEADKFIPQSKDSIKKIEEISRRGRKRGLGLLVATQRPSLVNKNVLSQCNNQILGKLSIENDLRAVDLFFSSRKELEELATLEPGEFFVMGNLSKNKTKIKFRQRETKHKSLTPKLVPRTETKIELKTALVKKEEAQPQIQIAGKSVRPKVTKEQAIALADKKRKRKFLAFGAEERISSIELVYHPLIFVEVKYLGGLLLKSPKVSSFIVDGIHAKLVNLNKGLKLQDGFSALVGLTEDSIRVLTNLDSKGKTRGQLEGKTRLSEHAVREAIRILQEKKLITEAGKIKRSLTYIPLIKLKLPKLSSLQQKLNLEFENLHGKRKQRKITESDLRKILKGIEPSAEIIKFQVFYYPLYEARLVSEKGARILTIDAVEGLFI